jgi:hypothetical protein
MPTSPAQAMPTSPAPELPSCPSELSDAARRGRLIIFVGAGFSRLAGSPGWEEFADAGLRFLARKGVLLDSELDQLRKLGSPRRRLSIAIELARKKAAPIPYKDILHPATRSADVQDDERRLFRALASTNGIFVTTNYDTWIEDYIQKGELLPAASSENLSQPRPEVRVYSKPEEFSLEKLGVPGSVFHLHGICTDPDTMVATTRGYLKQYADFDGDKEATSRLRTFLREMFDKYTILFLGYGLDELELLEYIINKGRSPVSRTASLKERRHFLLEGFYSHEQGMIEFLSDYYSSQCDVSLVSFNKDKQGYRQLIDVLESWAPQLRTQGLTPMEVVKDVERLSREADV